MMDDARGRASVWSSMARARAVDVWIVNKSGGLIYRRAFEDAGGGGRGGLDTNAQLRLAIIEYMPLLAGK